MSRCFTFLRATKSSLSGCQWEGIPDCFSVIRINGKRCTAVDNLEKQTSLTVNFCSEILRNFWKWYECMSELCKTETQTEKTLWPHLFWKKNFLCVCSGARKPVHQSHKSFPRVKRHGIVLLQILWEGNNAAKYEETLFSGFDLLGCWQKQQLLPPTGSSLKKDLRGTRAWGLERQFRRAAAGSFFCFF